MPSYVDIPFEDIINQVGIWWEEAAHVVAKEVLAEAKRATTFTDRTGKLRKSGKVKKSKFNKEDRIVIFDAPHAHLVENGHRITKAKTRWKGRERNFAIIGHVPARPFLGPAADLVRARAVEIIRKAGELKITVGK